MRAKAINTLRRIIVFMVSPLFPRNSPDPTSLTPTGGNGGGDLASLRRNASRVDRAQSAAEPVPVTSRATGLLQKK
jgi:hypothetical protein